MQRLFKNIPNPFCCNYMTKTNKVSVEDCVFDYHDIEDIIINWDDTTPFTVPIKGGKVIKVYDGDTFTLAGYLPYAESPLYRFSVRLNGIDTPEIKGKTEKEKECAILARTELQALILDKRVVLRNVQTEKYGRLLADVYIGDLHINQHMIDTGMAVKYDGGAKAQFI